MSQRTKIVAEIWGYRGWNVTSIGYERSDGTRVTPLAGFVSPELTIVLQVERRWTCRCATCGAITGKVHEQLDARRWRDLPWAGHVAEIEYAPVRTRCSRCGTTGVERLAWADPYLLLPHNFHGFEDLKLRTSETSSNHWRRRWTRRERSNGCHAA
jgi:hypothetical protein